MATTVQELQTWLSNYPPNWTVFVDEDGLTISVVSPTGNVKYYFELGGEPQASDKGAES